MTTIEHCPLPKATNVVSLPRGICLLRTMLEEGVRIAKFVKKNEN